MLCACIVCVDSEGLALGTGTDAQPLAGRHAALDDLPTLLEPCSPLPLMGCYKARFLRWLPMIEICFCILLLSAATTILNIGIALVLYMVSLLWR